MNRCPYCGTKTGKGAKSCSSCGKEFGKSNQSKRKAEKPSGMTNLDAYERTIPSWIFILIVAIGILGLILIFTSN